MNDQPVRQTFFGGCPHDCPDTCAMIYEVEEGRLVEVKGNKDHPMTRGTLCVKLKDYHDHHYNPVTPMAKAPSVPGFGMMCQSACLAVRDR